MDNSYFYSFKIHYEWEDQGREIIACSCRLADKEENDLNRQVALIKINLKDNKVHYLTKVNFDIKMPKEDFEEFILKSANRWVEKQLGEKPC
jgi:hypothetical protein